MAKKDHSKSMQTVLAVCQMVVAIVQLLTLIALVVTAVAAVRQFKSATEQAHASEIQAKASERMAQLSIQQTELMRLQVHSAFKPVLDATPAEFRVTSITFVLRNVGNNAALGLTAICRSGYQQEFGTVGPGDQRRFTFQNTFNLVPPVVGSQKYREEFDQTVQRAPLRLEYSSVSGAKYWMNLDFPLGRDGAVDVKIEHGEEIPKLQNLAWSE
jgi:hypothetical protein